MPGGSSTDPEERGFLPPKDSEDLRVLLLSGQGWCMEAWRAHWAVRRESS